ncbi:MAG: Gfo/Idh/MocA family oxidoreductase [Planctomycetales bacterium]|nr:Gfo/Idh/MocA family oxidoreductase [Planctomycetales bacterium]
MPKTHNHRCPDRRAFLAAGSLGLTLAGAAFGEDAPIQGFEKTDAGALQNAPWRPVSERKIRVGIAGYGVCRFGAAFGFQDHPNVEVAAVTDLFADRCRSLAQDCRCEKTYPSLEEMVQDDSLEAVFLATDAPSHARHAMLCLNSGKHVACAVPAVYGSLEDGELLYEIVRRTGLSYMMFETSAFQADCYAMRQAYRAGAFGKLIYSEGQYYHYFPEPLASYQDWRVGIPPMWYPTHSTAYYIAVTGLHYTEVSCQGFRGVIPQFQADANRYQNPFDSETALFRTAEGGSSRMSCYWGAAGSSGEYGQVRGERGAMNGTEFSPAGDERINNVALSKPQLPPSMQAGGHGGSHGYLTDEFVTSLLQARQPMIDIAWSLNMTVPGIVAHQSALNDGELLKTPHYELPAAG